MKFIGMGKGNVRKTLHRCFRGTHRSWTAVARKKNTFTKTTHLPRRSVNHAIGNSKSLSAFGMREVGSERIHVSAPSIIQRIMCGFRGGGLRWFLRALSHRILPPRLAMESAVLAATALRSGLEIGGPSRVFEANRLLPIYPLATRIDNVNFSVQTAWEKTLGDGGEFRFDPTRQPGTQWIRDAVALKGIGDHTYDFILSSHCLEHVANPLRALREWNRVTRPGGHIILILPNPAETFDHRRPITTMEHLRHDLDLDTGENDETHLPEIVVLHDLARDPWAGSRVEFRERARRNFENRCLHHHVFDLALMIASLEESGWRVLTSEKASPVHLIAFGQR
jgi:SAM-dependent methyltransferase